MIRSCVTAAVSLLALLVLGLTSSNGAATRGPVSLVDLAPADAYFGHQRLSPLGIRHQIFSLKDDLHHARRKPDAIEHDAAAVEDALTDWLAHFPNDSWIPSAAWQLATLYEELPGAQAQAHAITVLQLIKTHFADTAFGGYASRDLARGVGVRAWPHWAGPAPVLAAASPTASNSATPSAAPPTVAPVTDPQTLVKAIVAQNSPPQSLEERFWALSRNGTDPAYARAAWELAAAYERISGEDAQTRAIKLLALLVDRYPDAVYGRWALRDLRRGIGDRSGT